MKILRLLVINAVGLSALLFMSACAVGPVHGLIFSNTKFAGAANPYNTATATKSARGCSHRVLALFAWGDAGAGQIAKDNGIKKIATVDHSSLSILSLVYANYCTIVSGE